MFKKLKDKLAEEVKSSPQRIHQFAQAAQAAVTSASSSISDITNNDLFSIGDSGSDSQQNLPIKLVEPQQARAGSSFVPLQTSSDLVDFQPGSFQPDIQRQRRLSNSSFASDVSFKLPSYESPSIYHLQSDMEVSASEAEERAEGGAGAAGGGAGLGRVSEEQLLAAYRRAHERYAKYRAQYADLARHYKLLERENAKAKSVLVETQDKALRRISELREQCSLEQSAKAHLERALRLEIDEKTMKIDTLTTKIDLLQANNTALSESSENNKISEGKQQPEAQLIDISLTDKSEKPLFEKAESQEFLSLKNKVEKMEQLINKYKESLKAIKEKNTQLTTDLQVMSNDLENTKKENDQLQNSMTQLSDALLTIEELKNTNEDLQNKLNTYDFTKTKELTTLELDLQKEREEILKLKQKIEVYSKKEEEYAISLAENKLRIHKELENKEAEIKSLKDSLSANKMELQSIGIIASDYKQKISALEEEKLKLNDKVNELHQNNSIMSEKDAEILHIKQKCTSLEQLKTKADEEYKCLQLQINQETAEKLAMADRNAYLEDRIKQLTEDVSKKTLQLNEMQIELQIHRDKNNQQTMVLNDAQIWKKKYETLESEIQEERVELVKLQAEIEKLLKNGDFVQSENSKLQRQVSELRVCSDGLKKNLLHFSTLNKTLIGTKQQLTELKSMFPELVILINSYKESNKQFQSTVFKQINEVFSDLYHKDEIKTIQESEHCLKYKIEILENTVECLKAKYECVSKEVKEVKSENKQLTEQNNKNNNLQNEIKNINYERDNLLSQLQDLKIKLIESEAMIQINVEKNNHLNKEYDSLQKEYSSLMEKYAQIEETSKINQDQLEKTLEKFQDNLDTIGHLETENKDLIMKVNNSENLTKRMKALIEENNELKRKFDGIVVNVTGLENELSEVKKSHLVIEEENNHLNIVLKELEQNLQKKTVSRSAEAQTIGDYTTMQLTIDTAQAENDVLKTRCEQIKQEKETLYEKVILLDQKCTELQTELDNKLKIIDEVHKTSDIHLAEKEDLCIRLREEVESLKKYNMQLATNFSDLENDKKASNTHQQLNKHIINEALEKYESLKREYDVIKEDNRRLQSDVDGLQSYLTKISKENSILNDKLREVIATSEHLDTNESQLNSMSKEIKQLNVDVLAEKDKSDELARQNALITEENMELKDQLRSQTHENTVIFDKNDSSSKYEQLIKSKTELDNQVLDLKQQNKSTHDNMVLLQESNQKLRLTNEKLERRLDESLVSLRHLHSLQENTELEYLKNILFEYLTGSGTHSVTLAKVLAAVVKFDDKQTNAVLQKEKERQGLLRQLGLI